MQVKNQAKGKQVASKAKQDAKQAKATAEKAVKLANRASKAVVTRPPPSTVRPKARGTSSFINGPRGKSTSNSRRMPVMHNAIKSIDPYLGALIDPFSPNNNQIKIPDAHNYPSVATKLAGQDKLTTDANGNFCIGYRPWLRSYKVTGLVVDSTLTADWADVEEYNMDKLAEYYENFALARVVAWGIRLGYTAQRQNCQGVLHLAIVPNDYAVIATGTNTWPTTTEQFACMPYYECWQLSDLVDKQLVIPGRPIDAGSQRYRDTAAPITDTPWIESSDGWSTIVMMLTGCQPNTAVLNIDWAYHMEGLQRAGTAMSGTGGLMENSPARDYNPTVLAKASKLGKKLPPSYHREDKFSDFKDMIDRLVTGSSWDVDVGSILSSVFKMII